MSVGTTTAFDAEAANAPVLEFLERERDQAPEGVDAQLYRKAVEYSIGRYEVGLPHYVEGVRKSGLRGGRRVLDVGSGAGHWTLALALENDEVHGLELREEYVEVARRVAALLGFDQRVSYSVGRAEEASFPESAFDLACCHGVLMFTDHETVFRNLVRWVEQDGLFYLGYTTIGLRLKAIVESVAGLDWKSAQVRVNIVLADFLYRCGVHRTPRSRVRVFGPDELVRLGAAVGFELVDRPGVQDVAGDFAGHPLTADFLFRRAAREPELRRLSAPSPAAGWPAALEALIADGLPHTACELIEGIPAEERDPSLLSLYARALIKAGRAGDPECGETVAELEGAEHALTRGLYEHERGKAALALQEYESLPDDHPDKSFLQATCLLNLEKSDEAARAPADEPGMRGWVSRLAVALAQEDEDTATGLVRSFLTERREAGFERDVDPLLVRLG